MGKGKFIDKKKSATFQLLARDTSDPNYSGGPSGDLVFVRVDSNPYTVEGLDDVQPNDDTFSVDGPNSKFADAPEADYGTGYGYFGYQSRKPLPDHIRREIIELGFPDDGYNYLAHLREIKNTGGGSVYYENPKAKLEQLPPDVKAYNASRVEIGEAGEESDEKTVYAVASKTFGAKIEKVVDDEIAALLDDSDLSQFGSDVEDLEEDFVAKANLPEGPSDLELNNKSSVAGEKSGIVNSENKYFGISESRKSAVDLDGLDAEKPRARRPLDEQFDLLELQEYGTDGEDEYGGCYTEEDEPHESLVEKLNNALKCSTSDTLLETKQEEDMESPEATAEVIRRCREYAEKYENETEDEKMLVFEESSDESEIWDCETIISTFSNLDNHPGKIGAPEIRRKKKLAETISGALNSTEQIISLKGKQRLPVDFLPGARKNSTEKLKDTSNLKPGQPKKKPHGQESKEEKKGRKAAVKEERREARRMKKEMKGLYKGEAKLAQKVAAFTGPSSIHLM